MGLGGGAPGRNPGVAEAMGGGCSGDGGAGGADKGQVDQNKSLLHRKLQEAEASHEELSMQPSLATELLVIIAVASIPAPNHLHASPSAIT